MRKIGALLTVVALAAIVFPYTPSQAFGLRVGPFYFGIPYFGHRYRHWHHDTALHDEASLNNGTPAQDRGLTPPLLYPVLALPSIYAEIFSSSPLSSPWPFRYDAIFQAAFAKTASDQNSNSCPQAVGSAVIVDRIRTTVRPNADQMQRLQKLGGALGMASGYLAKACPTDVPQDPAARLQLMEWQIEKVAEALDIVRQPLQEFEQSLTAAQRARFEARPSTAAASRPDRADSAASDCAAAPTRVDSSVEQISLAIDPTDAQRDAMAGLKQAFRNAASELDANCPAALPADPLARLESTEARLDATWRALVAIQTALANLENGLSDDQRARLYGADFTAAQ
jgi:LTXXQ motif family protein